jgi:predicted DCC family thiol-disulfide oxidoreductase YuxK
MTLEKPEKIELVYDSKCLVCRGYCENIPLPDDMVLVDARNESETMREITRHGLDIDKGMVLKAGGQLFYASDAVHELAHRLPRRGLWPVITDIFFRSRLAAHIFYPPARMSRDLLLWILRIPKIDNLGRNKPHSP